VEEGQRRLFGDNADGETPPLVREASPDEIEERRRAAQLPIDQQALNVLGIAQARDQLTQGRAATVKIDPPCRHCGASVADVRPSGQHLSAWCRSCDRFTHHVPRTSFGLASRPVSGTRPRIAASRRARILTRDNGRCVLCGRSAAEGAQLTIGHLLSVRDGERLGAEQHLVWDDLNLAAMCDTCQLGLHDRSVPTVFALALLLLRAGRARRDGAWPNPTPDPGSASAAGR
jgi:hypothetical protein